MKRVWEILLAGLLASCACTVGLRAEVSDPDGVFAEANHDYAEGDYAQAVEIYGQLLPEYQSANLHYNLGNACYQLGDYGPAVLHYEKALALDPRNPDIRANLELTREAAQLTPPVESWAFPLSSRCNADIWAWLAAGSFWAVAALILLPPLFGWRGPMRGLLLALSIVLLVTSGVGLYGWHVRAREGVVLSDEATLRVAPTTTSPAAGAVAAGQLARIHERHGDYYLVTLDGGKGGWLSRQNFEPIWD